MDGRPGMIEPVFMKVWAGSWLICSVTIELMTQISSATEPMWGSWFDNIRPDFP